MGTIIAIDPGSRSIGYCVFNVNEWNDGKLAVPKASGVVSTKLRDLDSRCNELLVGIQADWSRVGAVYVEEPRIFGGSLGFAAKDSAMELMFFAGFTAARCHEFDAAFYFVSIQKWKGTMSKSLTARRVQKVWEKNSRVPITSVLTPERSHDWDACGIGFYAQGYHL